MIENLRYLVVVGDACSDMFDHMKKSQIIKLACKITSSENNHPFLIQIRCMAISFTRTKLILYLFPFLFFNTKYINPTKYLFFSLSSIHINKVISTKKRMSNPSIRNITLNNNLFSNHLTRINSKEITIEFPIF